ncbi:MAG: 16S rRNA (uracil(1498)-N(3))-methyltransferase [Chlorobiaceae bacterium]|nr:16S rRNA (uracil(1498)-N(3))-methyltransferase [Chlorobiaceae bacterium]
MDLFYVHQDQVDLEAGSASVDGEEFHHLVRVLRCREGDVVPITDGAGLSAELLISSIDRNSLKGELRERRYVPPPETKVSVAISLLKSPQRFDLFLEKATELGIDEIIPMMTQRTVSTPGAGKIYRKSQRWQGVVQSAARQSRRYHLPRLSGPLSFRAVLELEGYDLRMIAHESEERFPVFDPAGRRLLFLVGGEGGFTDTEVAEAMRAGMLPVSFGASVLRAETAGMFAVALVRARLLDATGGNSGSL